jgi:hypothetical protein
MMYSYWLSIGKKFKRFDGIHYYIFRLWFIIGDVTKWSYRYLYDERQSVSI